MKTFVMLLALLSTIFCTDASDKGVTLKGSFTNGGKTYPLKGVFTPAGKGKWTTVFTFTFGSRGPQVFKGTADGILKKGKLSGVVVERRKFVFDGKWEKNHFKGKTAEFFKEGGKPSPTGTIELKVAD